MAIDLSKYAALGETIDQDLVTARQQLEVAQNGLAAAQTRVDGAQRQLEALNTAKRLLTSLSQQH